MEKENVCPSIIRYFFLDIVALHLVFNRHLVDAKDLFGCILIILLFTFNEGEKNMGIQKWINHMVGRIYSIDFITRKDLKNK